MKSYVIARYLRLSVEDTKTGSTSIEGQREIIGDYIKGKFPQHNLEILDFEDNGYSGASLERPAISELLQLVEERKIDCVIVKDTSRLGRNFLESGYLIEKIFPLCNVRFIALAEMYDSDFKESNGINLAFRGILNEQYLHDMSKKIKSAKHSKMKQGTLISKNCIYGYCKDEYGKLDIDPIASETVKFVFSLALQDYTNKEISHTLYTKSILRPSSYKSKKEDYESIDYVWDSTQISRLVANEQYLGTYIMGKSEIKRLGEKSTPKPKSEWIVIENHHPAIIERSLFDNVQAQRSRRKMTSRTARPKRLLDGLVFCSCCSHTLARTNNGMNYVCRFGRYIKDFSCSDLKIHSADVEKAVLAEIKKLEKSKIIPFESLKNSELLAIDRQISQYYLQKKDLFEQCLSDEISEDCFQRENKEITPFIQRLEKEKARLTKKLQKNIPSTNSKRITLSPELIKKYIKKVIVFSDNSIEVEC